MDRIRLSDRFSFLSWLPWLLLALAIEQGPALSFYPDNNFSQQTELLEQAATDADYHLQWEEDVERNHGDYGITDTAFPAFSSNLTDSLPLKASSTFIHLYHQNLLISWIQRRSLPYQLS